MAFLVFMCLFASVQTQDFYTQYQIYEYESEETTKRTDEYYTDGLYYNYDQTSWSTAITEARKRFPRVRKSGAQPQLTLSPEQIKEVKAALNEILGEDAMNINTEKTTDDEMSTVTDIYYFMDDSNDVDKKDQQVSGKVHLKTMLETLHNGTNNMSVSAPVTTDKLEYTSEEFLSSTNVVDLENENEFTLVSNRTIEPDLNVINETERQNVLNILRPLSYSPKRTTAELTSNLDNDQQSDSSVINETEKTFLNFFQPISISVNGTTTESLFSPTMDQQYDSTVINETDRLSLLNLLRPLSFSLKRTTIESISNPDIDQQSDSTVAETKKTFLRFFQPISFSLDNTNTDSLPNTVIDQQSDIIHDVINETERQNLLNLLQHLTFSLNGTTTTTLFKPQFDSITSLNETEREKVLKLLLNFAYPTYNKKLISKPNSSDNLFELNTSSSSLNELWSAGNASGEDYLDQRNIIITTENTLQSISTTRFPTNNKFDSNVLSGAERDIVLSLLGNGLEKPLEVFEYSTHQELRVGSTLPVDNNLDIEIYSVLSNLQNKPLQYVIKQRIKTLDEPNKLRLKNILTNILHSRNAAPIDFVPQLQSTGKWKSLNSKTTTDMDTRDKQTEMIANPSTNLFDYLGQNMDSTEFYGSRTRTVPLNPAFSRAPTFFRRGQLKPGIKHRSNEYQDPDLTLKSDDIISQSTFKAECYICGLDEKGIPTNRLCTQFYSEDFLDIFPFDPALYSQQWKSKFQCYYKSGQAVATTVVNTAKDDGASIKIDGPFTGGCSVRWVDITPVYTQRTCRIKHNPMKGKNFASKRFEKLELLLKDVEDGCVDSPVASLLPLSRTISLYARFYVCVCSGRLCNQSELYQPLNIYIYIVFYIIMNFAGLKIS